MARFRTEFDALRHRFRAEEAPRPVDERGGHAGLSAAGEAAQLDNVYFRQLFENSPEAIVLLDNDDRVIDCNRAFAEMFGYALEEAKGRPINSLIVPPDMATQATGLSGRVLNGSVVATETMRRRKDGGSVAVRVLGYPIIRGDRQIGIFVIYNDITLRKQFERRLKLQSAAMNSAANAIIITSFSGEIVWVNRAFSRLSGYLEEEALGALPRLLDSGRSDPGLDPVVWQSLPSNGMWRGQVVNRHKDGHLYTVEQTVTPLVEVGAGVTHYVVVQEDISDRIEAEERLRHMARHDFLTDLPNRYTFNERLEFEVEHASKSGSSVAVLVLDLDQFKDVNDTYGHPIGDDLLVAVGKRLQATLRDNVTLARFGGDEFGVVQSDLHEPENAAGLAHRLLQVFRQPFALLGQEIHVSASIGIAVYPPGQADPKSLVKKADMALYRAKADGRGTFRFYEKEMDREVQSRMRLGQELHGALDRGELFLEYQPQIDLSSRTVSSVEALLRWRHPERGLVEPNRFVPIAEGSGLIVPIGTWVVRTACEEARAWQQHCSPPLPVAVNISAVQFKSPRFVESIVEALNETGVDPSQLELEITEGTLMQATPAVEEALHRLRELGVRLALDDFGTGYSSLEYLRRFVLNKLKIDRSFMRGLGRTASAEAIVSVVTMLGRKLDLEVVAEGVETEEQVGFLLAEGCRLAQGFYFSEPVAGAAIARMLRAGNRRINPRIGPRPSLT